MLSPPLPCTISLYLHNKVSDKLAPFTLLVSGIPGKLLHRFKDNVWSSTLIFPYIYKPLIQSSNLLVLLLWGGPQYGFKKSLDNVWKQTSFMPNGNSRETVGPTVTEEIRNIWKWAERYALSVSSPLRVLYVGNWGLGHFSIDSLCFPYFLSLHFSLSFLCLSATYLSLTFYSLSYCPPFSFLFSIHLLLISSQWLCLW